MTRGQRPSGAARMTRPVKNVGRKVNRNSASATPTKAAQVIMAFCTAGVACSSNHLSSLDSAGSVSPSIAISAACIRYL